MAKYRFEMEIERGDYRFIIPTTDLRYASVVAGSFDEACEKATALVRPQHDEAPYAAVVKSVREI